MADEKRPQSARAFEPEAIRKARGHFDRNAIALGPPFPERVIILEREPQGIHTRVTRGTGGIPPMRFHSVTNRPRLTLFTGVL